MILDFQEYEFKLSIINVVLIKYGSSEYGGSVWSELDESICLKLLFTSSATFEIIFQKRPLREVFTTQLKSIILTGSFIK